VKPGAIRFYRVSDEHGALSNFAPYPVRLKDREWPTSEHYFQAQKFAGTEHEEAVRAAASPMLAARMGRSRARPLRADWEEVKDSVMLEVVRAKIAQHPTVRALLLGTGERALVEASRKDRYWGEGGDGSGRNRLGEILMQVRAEQRRVELWRAVISGPEKSWVLFAAGTCVILADPTVAGDLAVLARAVLAEHGPVHVATPSADFSVIALEAGRGWVVGGDHPDILVHVAAGEAGGELAAGLLGRRRRADDAAGLEVIHVEDRRVR
jgi:ribA/ribD-fused uncharacterized protein